MPIYKNENRNEKSNWCVYATNDIFYSVNSDLNLTVDKINTTFNIVNNDRLKNMHTGIIDPDDDSYSIKVDIKDKKNVWLDRKTVFITHNLNSDVDCIVIGDGKYLNVEKNISNRIKISLRFNEDIKDYKSVFCYIYKVGNFMFPIRRIDKSQFSLNDSINDITILNDIDSSFSFVFIGKDGYSKNVPIKRMNNRIGIKKDALNEIETIISYSHRKSVSFDIEKSNCANSIWKENSLILNHGLNGHINLELDDTLFRNSEYSIYYISKNSIRIDFSKDVNFLNIRLFKISEE